MLVSPHISLTRISTGEPNEIPMSQDQLIQLKNKSTGQVYWTRKNKKLVTRKIELKKYDPKSRTHIVFKETKK